MTIPDKIMMEESFIQIKKSKFKIREIREKSFCNTFRTFDGSVIQYLELSGIYKNFSNPGVEILVKKTF